MRTPPHASRTAGAATTQVILPLAVLLLGVVAVLVFRPRGVPTATAPANPSAPPFAPTIPNAAAAPAPAPAGMVWIPGGEFSMGSSAECEGLCSLSGVTRDAQPIVRVAVDGFWMDATAVTNRQYAAFVAATAYVTVAETRPSQAEFPDAPPEKLVAGGAVFTPTPGPVPLTDHLAWWRYVAGADWRHPTGPDSTIAGRDSYPVVQIAYEDATAYARWAGKRLPTEAEFEFAARGGLTGRNYAWGDELTPRGKWMANIYQGAFTVAGGDTGADGFAGLAPVAQFPPNGYGLYDVAGNVWEWCSDWYRIDAYAQVRLTNGVARNPQGPDAPYDPAEPGEKKRVHRGGSFLCTADYCTRYLVGARGKGDERTASNHLGFRCVRAAR